MGVSYELSKREGRLGGPEKPLSELGRKGYLSFWEARVARTILNMRNKTTASLEEVADACWMLPDDVAVALKGTGALTSKKKPDGRILISKNRIREWVNRHAVDLTAPIDEDWFLNESEPERNGEQSP